MSEAGDWGKTLQGRVATPVIILKFITNLLLLTILIKVSTAPVFISKPYEETERMISKK